MQLDILTEREQLKADGANRAISHADNESPGWSDLACALTKEYLSQFAAGHTFMIYEVRQAIEHRLPPPPDNRAFTCISSYLRKEGIAKISGIGNTKNKTAHGNYASVYVKL